MKKRDLVLIIVIILAILLTAGVSFFIRPSVGGQSKLDEQGGVSLIPAQPSSSPQASPSASPETAGAAPAPTLQPAQAYLKITAGQSVSTPIPLSGESEFKLTLSDGSENVIHVTENAVWVVSANCADQSCIEQGTVSLQNRDARVLKNMIICLPHGVTLELLTPAEAQAEWEYWYGVQES